MNIFFDIEKCLLSLQKKRPVFHSREDFKLALAKEIQFIYGEILNITLDVSLKIGSRKKIDIIVNYEDKKIPIILKYKTAKLDVEIGGEKYNLKNHMAQDLGKYDCLKNIQELEELPKNMLSFDEGYTIWLTNDPLYWTVSRKKDAVCKDFSIYDGIEKNGKMEWTEEASKGTTKNREEPIVLQGHYKIKWIDYSEVNGKGKGIFKYAINQIKKMF